MELDTNVINDMNIDSMQMFRSFEQYSQKNNVLCISIHAWNHRACKTAAARFINGRVKTAKA